MAQFKEVIETRAQFRSLMREPGELVTRKTLDKLDKHCGVFINRAPFMILSSADAQGNMDVSPKGDPGGFVKIIDEQTLAIPDRPGNHRADTIENILQNPKVGLIFMIPGKSETLRVSGTASIVRSKLWEQDAWPDLNGLPRLAQTMVDAGKLDLSAEEMHETVLNDERERLY